MSLKGGPQFTTNAFVEGQLAALAFQHDRLASVAVHILQNVMQWLQMICTNYAASTNNFIGGYDISYADPRLRFVYATIQYALK